MGLPCELVKGQQQRGEGGASVHCCPLRLERGCRLPYAGTPGCLRCRKQTTAQPHGLRRGWQPPSQTTCSMDFGGRALYTTPTS